MYSTAPLDHIDGNAFVEIRIHAVVNTSHLQRRLQRHLPKTRAQALKSALRQQRLQKRRATAC